jgi:hypothetical protein
MSDNIQPPDVSKPNPVLVMAAVIAGLSVITAGLAGLDIISDKTLAIFNLVIAAITVGYGIITRGQVAPWADVAAKATPGGGLIAGPAASQTTGTPVVVGEVIPPENGTAE